MKTLELNQMENLNGGKLDQCYERTVTKDVVGTLFAGAWYWIGVGVNYLAHC